MNFRAPAEPARPVAMSTVLLLAALSTVCGCNDTADAAPVHPETPKLEAPMNDKSFTTTFTVDETPEEVFAAINDVRGWWSEQIDGDTDKLGARFDYRFKDVHRDSFKITEFVPGKRVVWHVLDNYFNFVKDRTEWTGNDIVFEIARKGGRTELRFTHVGLAPAVECYGDCSDAWRMYVNNSLFQLITKGRGRPEKKQS